MPDIATITTHYPSDPPTRFDLQQSTEPIINAVNDIIGRPEINSALIDTVSLTAAATVLIKHTLGRNYVGWYVVDKTADARVWRDTSSDAKANLYLPLACSADVDVKVVVF